MADGTVLKQADFRELGVSGRTGILYGYDELLPDLSGARAFRVYRQMYENDPVISAVFLAVEQVMRSVEWVAEPENSDPDSKQDAEFIAQCMDDMSHTWDDFITEVITFLQYGFSVFEIVYKLRAGGTEDDPPNLRSRYNDNKVGWRKFAFRHQETIREWILDDAGGIRGIVQHDYRTGRTVQIPIQKLLLFRTKPKGGDPFGYSLLRGIYRAWKFKKYIEEVEGIGVERDLAGLPLIECPEGVDIFAPDNAELYARLQELLKNVRRDKYEGVIMPAGYRFSLIASTGTKQFDTNRIINRYDQRIALGVLAQFVLLGIERVGSYALASQQKDLFTIALEGWLNGIEDIINRFAVERLLRLNNMKTYPVIKHRPIVQPTSAELAVILQRLAQVGLLFPDNALETWIRRRLALPMGSNGTNGDRTQLIRHILSDFDEGGLSSELKSQIAEAVGEEKAEEVISIIQNHLAEVEKDHDQKTVRRKLLQALLAEIK